MTKEELLDDKYYIINLDTNKIEGKQPHDCIFGALEGGNGRLQKFTAMKGSYLKVDDRFTVEEGA